MKVLAALIITLSLLGMAELWRVSGCILHLEGPTFEPQTREEWEARRGAA